MKKVISVILSLAMLLSITAGFNINVYADIADKTGKCGENVTYILNEPLGTIVIEGDGNTYDYTEENEDGNIIYTSPFRNKSIKKVTIKSGVTNIGNGLFYNCRNLEYIEIPQSVSSIESNAFYKCSNLKRIKYDGTKSNWFNVKGSGNIFAFVKCDDCIITRNSDVTVNGMKFTLYDDNTAIFIGCENPHETVLIPSYVTYFDCSFTVYALGDAFMNCTGVKNVIIPNSVKILCEGAFLNCTDLMKVTIPESVTIIGDLAFDGCKKLSIVNYGGTMAQWKKIKIYDDGNDALYCASIRCSDGVINKHIHSFSTDWKIITPANCVTKGVIENVCDTCGETVTQYTSANPNAHDFSNNAQSCRNYCGTANPNYAEPSPAEPTPTVPATTAPTTTTTKSVAKPKSASIKKLKSAKKAVVLEWKKVSGVNGYEIQVATDKKIQEK